MKRKNLSYGWEKRAPDESVYKGSFCQSDVWLFRLPFLKFLFKMALIEDDEK